MFSQVRSNLLRQFINLNSKITSNHSANSIQKICFSTLIKNGNQHLLSNFNRGVKNGPQINYSIRDRMSFDNSNKTHVKINDLITKSKKRVFLFMKGTPKEPACGYSGVVVQILNAYGVDYDSVDVYEDEEIRKGIKSYSDWPTIPQVYVDGSFVGGCDILLQMQESGELKSLLEKK